MEEAMRRCADKFDFVVRWKPFLLRPGTPLEGRPLGPGVGPPKAAMERVKAVGKTMGLDFTFKMDREPNTLPAHALLEYAATVDGGSKQNDLQEAIFKSFFTDGVYPDARNLTQIAKQLGFDEQEVYKITTDPEQIQKAFNHTKEWSSKGVSGVPFFFINGQGTFSGAQDPEAFISMFEVVAKKFPNAASS